MSVDDVLWPEPADVVCNGGDDVAAEFFCFAEVFTLQAELFLLVHVLASHSADLVHDVEDDGFRCTVARSGMLVLVAYVAAGDVHGSIGREGDAVRELLAPAWCSC